MIAQGKVQFSASQEDIHMAIEELVTKKAGKAGEEELARLILEALKNRPK